MSLSKAGDTLHCLAGQGVRRPSPKRETRSTALLARGVRRPSPKRETRGLIPALPGRFIPVTSKSQLHFEGSRPEWCILSMIYSRDTPFRSEIIEILLPWHTPSVIGPVPGLAGLLSPYCDQVRWQVSSTTSISKGQYVRFVSADPSLTYTCMLGR